MEKKYNFYDKDIIGHTEIRNLDCFYFTRYYPVNKYGYNENQDFIFEFKEGTCPEIYARIFSRTILSLFGDLIYRNQENHTKFLEKTIILPVPASTQEKHKQRYEDLFRLISEKTGIGNGYKYIKIKNDVEAKHLNNNRTSLDEHIEIDYSFLKEYRHIILIDDVITTGKTISEFADKFRKLEYFIKDKNLSNKLLLNVFDYSIIGLTLAKTVSQVDLLSDELKDDEFDKKENKTFYKNSFNILSKLDSLEVWKNLDEFHLGAFPDSEDVDIEEDEYGNVCNIKEYTTWSYEVFHTKFKSLNEEINLRLEGRLKPVK
jgi:hypoxanthine phosphoribosyltransferase